MKPIPIPTAFIEFAPASGDQLFGVSNGFAFSFGGDKLIAIPTDREEKIQFSLTEAQRSAGPGSSEITELEISDSHLLDQTGETARYGNQSNLNVQISRDFLMKGEEIASLRIEKTSKEAIAAAILAMEGSPQLTLTTSPQGHALRVHDPDHPDSSPVAVFTLKAETVQLPTSSTPETEKSPTPRAREKSKPSTPKAKPKAKAKPSPKKAKPRTTLPDATLASVFHNTEKEGVEITFNGKPSEEIRAKLKDSGFSWSSRQGKWWNYYTETIMKEAEEIAASLTPATV